MVLVPAMKSISFALLFIFALLPSAARADLSDDIKVILRDKYLNKADLSIAVAKLGSAQDATKVIYKLDSDIPLIPASNLKLLTTSAFLDHFGSDFKFHTVLLMKENDLFLIGDGDPTLGDVEMLKKLGWDVDTVFKAWAEDLKKRGVNSVRNVVVDDSVFDEEFIHPHWLSRYAGSRYSAQIAGVTLNANCVDFWVKATSPGQTVGFVMDPDTRYVSVKNQCITGKSNSVGVTRPPGKNDLTLRGEVNTNLGEPISVPIQDPPMFAATVLAETLARSGVTVAGSVSRDRTVRDKHAIDPAGWSVVAALDTKLATVLDRANKDSMNLYAESMCKRLGNAVSGLPGSWANGTAAVGAFLKSIGVPESHFHLDDGCGLSRENTVSSDALLQVLSYNFHGKNRETFLASLAVAGADGTFEKRFKNNLRGRVFGKSGYVSGVSALSGYLKAQDGEWYAFSILMNGLGEGTNSTAKTLQEKIVAAIDENAAK
jgi:D-alanyl-D-alanine carboxypeptidase/D-alanyl-D-alanine-endopeptidase (penicillin-binding protein 4)